MENSSLHMISLNRFLSIAECSGDIGSVRNILDSDREVSSQETLGDRHATPVLDNHPTKPGPEVRSQSNRFLLLA